MTAKEEPSKSTNIKKCEHCKQFTDGNLHFCTHCGGILDEDFKKKSTERHSRFESENMLGITLTKVDKSAPWYYKAYQYVRLSLELTLLGIVSFVVWIMTIIGS